MALFTDWTAYVKQLRTREVRLIFQGCPPKAFDSILELGAGRAFQARHLANYARQVVSTDRDRKILQNVDDEVLAYEVCDAERLAEHFGTRRFDVVFSSNMLEHLEDPAAALCGIHRVLTPGGITIHVMPSPFWKLSTLSLHVPAHFGQAVERWRARRAVSREVPATQSMVESARTEATPLTETSREGVGSRLRRLLVPGIHGVSRGHVQELLAFRRSRWVRLFRACGFEVVAVQKGVVTSGYGFGFDRLRTLLEHAGLASAFVYVAKRAGEPCGSAEWFGDRSGVSHVVGRPRA